MENADAVFSILSTIMSLAILFIMAGFIWALIYALTRRSKMDFTFTVGEKEKHKIRFLLDYISKFQIEVDGEIKYREYYFGRRYLVNRYPDITLEIGNLEKHTLRFNVLARKFADAMAGAFGNTDCDIYLDGKLFKKINSNELKKST